MASTRVGLKQVSNANTSPQRSVLHAKKVNTTNQAVSPTEGKSEVKNKENAVPTVDNKENQGIQASVEVVSSHAQTDILAIKPNPPLSKEDLLCEEVTSSYWREMAERFEKEIDVELETSFNVCDSVEDRDRGSAN
ncbi:hypothetical protein KIN20_017193 [Parelaphostrongylus tenuis]|uniref:Uncharacterized protein n=1 Tax=Parelaphostrongylus tenuis TaxID=148309 RepID=A0AAD5N0J6_PARTN|nr:hypothetical protein KIN20_017193 [Parelaphostrongylus tenuis]